MSDLVEFLRARLDEDEKAAKAWLPFGNSDAADRDHIARHDPARVLREVDAKRRLIQLYEAQMETGGFVGTFYANTAEPSLRLLALPYADDPEYREEWRP